MFDRVEGNVLIQKYPFFVWIFRFFFVFLWTEIRDPKKKMILCAACVHEVKHTFLYILLYVHTHIHIYMYTKLWNGFFSKIILFFTEQLDTYFLNRLNHDYAHRLLFSVSLLVDCGYHPLDGATWVVSGFSVLFRLWCFRNNLQSFWSQFQTIKIILFAWQLGVRPISCFAVWFFRLSEC